MSSELKEMNNAEESVIEEVSAEETALEEAVEERVKEEPEVANAQVPDLEEVVTEVESADTRDFELRVSDEDKSKKKKRQEIWDKITTGLLIFLMSSPILILAYIFIWFLTK